MRTTTNTGSFRHTGGIARRIVASLIAATMADTAVCTDAPSTTPPGLTWTATVSLLAEAPAPITADAITKAYGVKLQLRVNAADEYDAWLPSARKRGAGPTISLTYGPWRNAAEPGRHASMLQIFVRDFACVSVERMQQDFARAGFTAVGIVTPTAHQVSYKTPDQRTVRVTYPAASSLASRQLHVLRHGGTDEDSRCVGDVFVAESG